MQNILKNVTPLKNTALAALILAGFILKPAQEPDSYVGMHPVYANEVLDCEVEPVCELEATELGIIDLTPTAEEGDLEILEMTPMQRVIQRAVIEALFYRTGEEV